MKNQVEAKKVTKTEKERELNEKIASESSKLRTQYEKLIQTMSSKCPYKLRCIKELRNLEKKAFKNYGKKPTDLKILNKRTVGFLKNLKELIKKENESCTHCTHAIENFLKLTKKHVNENLPLVAYLVDKSVNSILKHCSTYKIDSKIFSKEDLHQQGIAVLIECLLNYDPKRGNFTSYAYKTTYEKLKVYAIKNSGPLSINQSTFNRLLETGMIKDFEKPISIEESPLIETLKTNGDDAIARIESIENRNLARFIKKVASCTLTPRQEFILRKKLGLDGEDQCTFKEIAEQEGVSRTSVKRHFEKAMKKLTCEINLHSIARKRIVLKVKNKKK